MQPRCVSQKEKRYSKREGNRGNYNLELSGMVKCCHKPLEKMGFTRTEED